MYKKCIWPFMLVVAISSALCGTDSAQSPPTVQVTGVVTPPGIGAEVSVRGRGDLQDWKGVSIKVDADGNFGVELPGPGAYTITATAQGYAGDRQYVQLTSQLQKELTFELVRAGGISGRIINAPLNTIVYAQRKGEDMIFDGVTMPDRTGRYRIDGLKPGRYSLTIWTADYRSVKGVSPNLRDVGSVTRGAITRVIHQLETLKSAGRYADAIPLYSKNYACGTGTYSNKVHGLQREEERVRKTMQEKGITDAAKVGDPVHYKPLLIYKDGENVEAVCFTSFGTGLNLKAWGNARYRLFRFAKEADSWLITANCDFSAYPVDQAMPVIDARLADIVVEAGKISEGHNYTLAKKEPKLPPDPLRLPAK